jgi:enoyl-CoA hydratase/3-hydroxyacyl-CoA dehydrogenase
VPTLDTIRYDLDERGLLRITLDRPERLNALNAAVRADLLECVETVDTDSVRCVALEGAGEQAFSAGADVAELESMEPTSVVDVKPETELFSSYPRPTVALVDGLCLGGGLELALSCDLRLATTESRFGFPEVDLGLYPGGGATVRLPRLVGLGRAKELIFRGQQIDAETAAEWGLVNHATPPEAFDDLVDDVVSDLVGGPPVALKLAKRAIDAGLDSSAEAALELETNGFAVLAGTDDVAEGVAAFDEDREPSFRGA